MKFIVFVFLAHFISYAKGQTPSLVYQVRIDLGHPQAFYQISSSESYISRNSGPKTAIELSKKNRVFVENKIDKAFRLPNQNVEKNCPRSFLTITQDKDSKKVSRHYCLRSQRTTPLPLQNLVSTLSLLSGSSSQ